MFVASGPVAAFVARHPTTKMLALAFLLLIGVSLVADGAGFHIEKGYIYAAMGFSVLVEAFNILAKQRRMARSGVAGHTVSEVKSEAAKAVPESAAREAVSPAKPRRKSTSAARAQSRPKSSPRK
jgi:hypothetical protein